jgi:hypothetical protein
MNSSVGIAQTSLVRNPMLLGTARCAIEGAELDVPNGNVLRAESVRELSPMFEGWRGLGVWLLGLAFHVGRLAIPFPSRSLSPW